MKKTRKATLEYWKYRRGMPWLRYEEIPDWIQRDRRAKGKEFTLAECRDALERMVRW